ISTLDSYMGSRDAVTSPYVWRKMAKARVGPPCNSPQSDLHLAVRRSPAGLNLLAGSEFVDTRNIFILAHSIGPLEGVFVAQKFPIRGFIAPETIGKSWFEYQLDNARRQTLLF